MAETSYSFSISTDFGGSVDTRRLSQEIIGDGVQAPVTINTTGDALSIVHDPALSGADETTQAATVAAHGLKAAKWFKGLAVDRRTTELIAGGFTYATKQFSLSLPAQINWMDALVASGAAGFSYPYPVATLDNNYYLAADEAEMILIATAARDRRSWAVATGVALKKPIKDAADQAALDAVVDER